MRGMDIFQKPYHREIITMRGRPMRGTPVVVVSIWVKSELASLGSDLPIVLISVLYITKSF